MSCSSLARAALAGAGLACAAAALGAAAGHANGRLPATTNVHFQTGNAETFYVPVTFGLLKSTDGGESYRWVCESAVGYTGTFDPDYAVDTEGNVYASTFEGVRVSRDGACTWETVVGLDEKWYVSEVEVGPDGRVWVATSNGGQPNDVYVSDDGTEFVSSGLPLDNGWWTSLRTTPAEPAAGEPPPIYVSGFFRGDKPADNLALLRRSDDGGESWQELDMSKFDFASESSLALLGVSPTDPNLVFAHVPGIVPPIGDALYRSADGGVTWERVLEFANQITAFHIRPDGQTVIAGTSAPCPGEGQANKGCVRISREAGALKSWAATKQQPKLACIGERSDGMLFGCGDNWAPDNFALGRSPDGETWEKVYRVSETVGPLDCESGTEQAACSVMTWPGLCEQLGICDPPDAGPPEADAGGVTGEDDDGEEDGGGGGGCCRVGGGSDAGWVPGFLVALFFLGWGSRRRRR